MRIATIAGSALFALATAVGQTGDVRFEVASVRPSTDMFNLSGNSWGVDTGRVMLPYITIGAVIRQVYGLRVDQLKGPKWLDDERFQIQATAPAGTSRAQINQMMQALLIERFQMKFHREINDSPVYALMLRKGAMPPQESASDPTEDTTTNVKMDRAKETVTGALSGPFGRIHLTATNAGLRSEFDAVSMEGLAAYLSQGLAGLPVVDKTGLKGTYRVALDVTTADLPGVVPAKARGDLLTPSEPSGYSVINSLHRQGLDLARERAPVEYVVIDSIARVPTAN